MTLYDATEQAYKNGYKTGYDEGYSAGYRAGKESMRKIDDDGCFNDFESTEDDECMDNE